MIDNFDINCVFCGFYVRPKLDDINLVVRAEVDPTWYRTTEFEDFLKTRKIKISGYNNPAGAILRLLSKSKQLGLDYEWPDEATLRGKVHGQSFGIKNLEQLATINSVGLLQRASQYSR